MQEQFNLLKKDFHEYPNVFIFLCSLTEASHEISELIYSKLRTRDRDVITAVRCIYESKWLQDSTICDNSVSPFTLNLAKKSLLPYDCICVSYVLSFHPVSQLIVKDCNIGDKGIKLFVRCYVPYQNNTGTILEELDLEDNKITLEGLEDVMKIVRKSENSLGCVLCSN